MAVPTSTTRRLPPARIASIRPESRLRIGIPSGSATASIASGTAWGALAVASIHSRSVESGNHVLSLFDMLSLRWVASRTSHEEARAEVQPGREDRARGDRADVDVQEPGR